MKNYFLDTSIIIDYLRGKEKAIKIIDQLDGNLTSSYICLSELFEGIYRLKQKEKFKKIILSFFNSLNTIFTIDEKVAEKFGELRKHLKEKGKVIEDIDIFIAATCITNNLILVTFNKKHFSRIKDLKIF